MKVLHYVKSFSVLSETFIYEYITELERQGITNYVVTENIINITERPFSKVYKINVPSRWNIQRVLRRIINIFNSYNYLIASWPQIRNELQKAILKLKPDIIHAHFGSTAVLIAPIAKKYNIPLVVTFYGFDISQLTKEKFWCDKYQYLWKYCSAITVLSNDMKLSVASQGCQTSKINVVHLSRKVFLNTRKCNNAIKNFVSIGRLTEKKGHDDVILAFSKLKNEGINLTLEIIGDGELKSHLNDLINKNNLTDCIKLIGALSNEDTMSKLNLADAFILASKTASNGDKEGTPTVLVEAQLLGVPLVSTLHAGIPEMIPKENSWLLADENNVESLSNCIKMLINCNPDEIKMIVENGRNFVHVNYNLENEVSKLINVYQKLL